VNRCTRLRPPAVVVLALAWLLAGCGPGAAPDPRLAPADPAPAPSTLPAVPTAGQAGDDGSALPTRPVVDLKVGTIPTASVGPFFIAQARGYFKEAGLNVEFSSAPSVNQHLPALAQGQLHVSVGSSNLGQYNALARQLDLAIVADLQSAGKTAKSIGNSALVVRKDLWDSAALREPRDLLGKRVGIIGPGSGHHIQAIRWLRGQGLDHEGVEWVQLSFADQLAGLQNGGIDASIQTEPLLTAGLNRGAYQIMATQEDLNPDTQVLYVIYWSGIDRLGPRVGERFMVGYLKGVRDYLNAFEYGIDEDAIIDILIQETPIKDAAIYRQIKYAWVDPNGRLGRAQLEADVELLRDIGALTASPDLGAMIQDRYRQLAVQHLGEYRPPR
jgi:NitT/TauT family transport system substrate-binding protein